MLQQRHARRLARIAALLAFASAAITAYWTAGGTLLLDTVGGEIEELARSQSLAAVALGVATIVAKTVAGILALQLERVRDAGELRRRLVLVGNGIASTVLCLWGGANVVVGALVLSDIVNPSEEVDRHALRWHVFVWDMWFLVWGLALALALAASRRNNPRRQPATSAGDDAGAADTS